MNFQNLNFDFVEAPRQGPPQFSTSQIPGANSRSTHHTRGRSLGTNTLTGSSLSPQASVAPAAPSPPSFSSSSPDLYGPDRHFGAVPPQGYAGARPATSPGVRFDEAQLAMFAADNSARMASIKDELTIAAGKVTPGVDDTPYIQYALEALTRDPGSKYAQHFPSGTSASYPEEYSPPRQQEDEQREHPATPAPPEPSHVQNRVPVETQPPKTRNEQKPSPPDLTPAQNPESNRWVPVGQEQRRTMRSSKGKLVPLTYKPRILRPFSMLILMALSILMLVALIFSAIYSDNHNGLTPYPGSIYSGQYFVFRILPQLLAAIILIYAQSIVVASLRILPFCALADEDPQRRHLALFRRLYPRSFLWPQMSGPWQVKAFGLATWLTNFTIPLQSAAFTCIYVNRGWRWATVPGVVWTLVALYILLVVATATLMTFWFRRWTGLMWDIRSIGDLLPLLNHSNTLDSYEGMDIAEGGKPFMKQLQDRHLDRLGYWQMEDQVTGGVWYAIGTPAADEDARRDIVFNVKDDRISFGQSDGSRYVDVKADWPRIRSRYLPWGLRDLALIAFFSIMVVLLLALLIVSFLPQTRLDRGFDPSLSAKPSKEAFSAANFLYGFLPSLLGMILFLVFQSLDHSLRVLQPWGDLSHPNGSRARKSILADYAACLPFQSTWRAAMNCHWRVAVMSLMGVLFVFIPVLAGGLFMALTNPSKQVRMFPNMPVFGVLLAFLFLYVGCLSLMLPHCRQFRLPHPVTNLAEIISFCAATQTTQDAAFRSVRSHDDLEGRLGLDRENPRDESMWFFGTVAGRDEHHLSVRRINRFTEKRPRSRGSMV